MLEIEIVEISLCNNNKNARVITLKIWSNCAFSTFRIEKKKEWHHKNSFLACNESSHKFELQNNESAKNQYTAWINSDQTGFDVSLSCLSTVSPSIQGVIQQLRGPNSTQLWPPTPSSGQFLTFTVPTICSHDLNFLQTTYLPLLVPVVIEWPPGVFTSSLEGN